MHNGIIFFDNLEHLKYGPTYIGTYDWIGSI